MITQIISNTRRCMLLCFFGLRVFYGSSGTPPPSLVHTRKSRAHGSVPLRPCVAHHNGLASERIHGWALRATDALLRHLPWRHLIHGSSPPVRPSKRQRPWHRTRVSPLRRQGQQEGTLPGTHQQTIHRPS